MFILGILIPATLSYPLVIQHSNWRSSICRFPFVVDFQFSHDFPMIFPIETAPVLSFGLSSRRQEALPLPAAGWVEFEGALWGLEPWAARQRYIDILYISLCILYIYCIYLYVSVYIYRYTVYICVYLYISVYDIIEKKQKTAKSRILLNYPAVDDLHSVKGGGRVCWDLEFCFAIWMFVYSPWTHK